MAPPTVLDLRSGIEDTMQGIGPIGLAELLISGACCVLVLIVAMVILALILVLCRRE